VAANWRARDGLTHGEGRVHFALVNLALVKQTGGMNNRRFLPRENNDAGALPGRVAFDKGYMWTWLAYFAVFTLPVLLQGYIAWSDGFLTPAQMQAHGVAQGLPFVAHGAMWSDATLFAGTMATVMTNYARQWKARHWAISLAVGLVASAGMHWGVYVSGGLPEAHVRDGAVTSVGIIHFVYMGTGIAVVVLFYLFTDKPNPTTVKWVSILLVLHTIVGTHALLKLWATYTHPVWYPAGNILDAPAVATVLSTILALWLASRWALR